jgi:hypothetical protein
LEPEVVSQYCMNCGTGLPKQALFCAGCGQAVSQEIPEQPATSTQARASRVPSHSGEDEDLGPSAPSSARWGEGAANTPLRDWLERLVLYAALPVVTFYPLGVFLYWLQLMVNSDIDEDGAMYAIILMSREYVIGQMIWALTVGLQRIIPIVIPAVLISFIITTLGWRGIFGPGWKTAPLRRLATLVGLLALGGVLLYVLITRGSEGLPLRRIIGWVIILLGSSLGGYLAAKDRNRNKRFTEMTRAPLFVRRWPLRGILVLYSAMILNLCLSWVAAPPEDLPRVEFGEDQARESGFLLADPSTVDGYWYILDDREYAIRAIPNENMQEVLFVPDPTSPD